MRRSFIAVAVALMLATPAHAQQPTANDLFWAKQRENEARRLMVQKKTSEACKKFAESYERVADVRILLDLAACHEKEGKTATAYAKYKQARDIAGQDKNLYWRKVRTRTADARIAALEPKLSRLTITVPADAPGDLAVERDKTAVKKDEIGVAVPVDPGEHEISASASGRKPWRTTIAVAARGESKLVAVPQLEPEAGASTVVAEPPPSPASPATKPRPTVPEEHRAEKAQQPEPTKPRAALYTRTGFAAYLSDARTMGGVGGGFGVRFPIGAWPFLQLDASYLFMIGNVAHVRVGGGVERPGIYSPAATLLVSTFVGTGLRFLTVDHPVPIPGPAAAVGLHLAPLRFRKGGTHASLLEGGFGVGSDFPGLGLLYEATLLEVGTSF